VGLLAAVYAASARLGLLLDAVEGFATLVWPPSGIALAALLLGGPGLWPGIAVGAFAVNVLAGAPPLAACGIAAGNTAAAVLGALALGRVGFRPALDRVRDALALAVLAALLSTLVSATVGATALHLADVVARERLGATWRAWWLGDLAGIVIVAPVLLGWGVSPRISREPRRLLEGAALALAVGLGALFVFSELAPTRAALFFRPYLLFPLVVWAALRFDPRGVATASFLVAALAIAATALGRGPFVLGPLQQNLSHLQVFLGVLTLTALLLGAAVAELRGAQAETARLYREARRAVQGRDDFLSAASHELRTPLATLVLQLHGVERLARAPSGSGGAALPERVERVVRTTGRLTRLVEALFDAARISSGEQVVERADVDLAELAREVAGGLEDEARRAGCALLVRAEARVEGRWDRARLERVVATLVSNAVKCGPGGPVEVSVEAVAPDRARLSVRDHGTGAPAADLERSSGGFERAVPADFGGPGLGLHLARQIVAQHGGTLRVASEPGTGSVFTVELPRREPPGARPLAGP
jgi:signal transduction histidine kinase